MTPCDRRKKPGRNAQSGDSAERQTITVNNYLKIFPRQQLGASSPPAIGTERTVSWLLSGWRNPTSIQWTNHPSHLLMSGLAEVQSQRVNLKTWMRVPSPAPLAYRIYRITNASGCDGGRHGCAALAGDRVSRGGMAFSPPLLSWKRILRYLPQSGDLIKRQ